MSNLCKENEIRKKDLFLYQIDYHKFFYKHDRKFYAPATSFNIKHLLFFFDSPTYVTEPFFQWSRPNAQFFKG